MKTNSITNTYISKNQILSSLVLNPPYKIDGYSTAPRITKILSFPFGLKLDSALLFNLTFKFILSTSILMAVVSMLIFCFYLPLQSKNTQLTSSVKSLTNEKLNLLADLQEASSYKKLYENAENFSLKDTEEVIQIDNVSEYPQSKAQELIAFNKYPTIEFSGF